MSWRLPSAVFLLCLGSLVTAIRSEKLQEVSLKIVKVFYLLLFNFEKIELPIFLSVPPILATVFHKSLVQS